MARSRKKSPRRATSHAKATAAPTPQEDSPESSAEGSSKDPVATSARRTGKDPVTRSPTGKDSAPSKVPGKPAGGEVAEKAKDSTRSTSVKKAAAAESGRSPRRRVAAATQNPAWLAPTAVVLLIVGLAYLVTYYISAGQLPLPIGDWNLGAGFGVLMVGGGMLMFWK
ncbi:cell division protein CrgA [Brachybacterium vulturis]|uniref:cell division protein CrgA n=1 Tax=Brachybacterium vulturis TaxID=2017484 RepID=UPI0037359176